ncbi:MAG: glycosyltransferase family 4 protein, partial [Nitrospira sp.]|nr:glycosyltransferase family 4 protein [Nitrospira sp.]
TALINMAGELGKLGWDVKVFNNCTRPGKYDAVDYIHYTKFNEYCKENDIDIFISVRYIEPFLRYIPAKVKILWTEDAPDQPFLKMLKEKDMQDGIDLIITVSKWQAEGFIEKFNIPADKLFITTNGINPDFYHSPKLRRNLHRIIYSSTPFRGLDILLKVFPRIRASIPDAELHVYSGMSVYQMSEEQENRKFGEIYKLAEQPGVFLKKNVAQRELADAMLSSSIMAYPNSFPETSCISAIEAMAAGLPVVTSRSGALTETLEGVGIFVHGNPMTTEYQDTFVTEVINILNDRERRETISEKSRRRALDFYKWGCVANNWDEEFKARLKLIVSSEQKIEVRN